MQLFQAKYARNKRQNAVIGLVRGSNLISGRKYSIFENVARMAEYICKSTFIFGDGNVT